MLIRILANGGIQLLKRIGLSNMKVYDLTKLTSIVVSARNMGKRIVLVTGCFDIVHCGHIDLFRFAKKQGDLLIVGLDNDENIRVNKGKGRPIFDFKDRAKILEEMESIDYIFEIVDKIKFGSNDADKMLNNVLKILKPNVLVCNLYADLFIERKRKICDCLGVQLMVDGSEKLTSSTGIIGSLGLNGEEKYSKKIEK